MLMGHPLTKLFPDFLSIFFTPSLLIHGTNPITDELQRSMGTFGKQTLQCHFPFSFRASSDNEGFLARRPNAHPFCGGREEWLLGWAHRHGQPASRFVRFRGGILARERARMQFVYMLVYAHTVYPSCNVCDLVH